MSTNPLTDFCRWGLLRDRMVREEKMKERVVTNSILARRLVDYRFNVVDNEPDGKAFHVFGELLTDKGLSRDYSEPPSKTSPNANSRIEAHLADAVSLREKYAAEKAE